MIKIQMTETAIVRHSISRLQLGVFVSIIGTLEL